MIGPLYRKCRLDGLSIGLKSSLFLSDFGKMHAAVAKREIILYMIEVGEGTTSYYGRKKNEDNTTDYGSRNRIAFRRGN